MKFKIYYNAKQDKYAVAFRKGWRWTGWWWAKNWEWITKTTYSKVSDDQQYSIYKLDTPLDCDKIILEFKKEYEKEDVWKEYLKL